MENKCFIIFLSEVVLCFTFCYGQGVCSGVTPCYCKFENGQYLYLAGLAKTDGTPRFVNISDKHEMVYSLNPCSNFTQGECEDVAICGIQPSLPHDLYLPLGYQNMTTFITNRTDNSVTLVYKTYGNPVRTSFLALICTKGDPENSYIKAIGQKQQLSTNYYFELRSPLACPQGKPSATSTMKPKSSPVNSALEASLVAVSILALALTVALIVVVLKMKGKICKGGESYDQL